MTSLTENMIQSLEQQAMPAAWPLLQPPSVDADLDVFEGPEKKLEVFFHPPDAATGLRSFGADDWTEVLAAASCSILHVESNAQFDAYLLSESSLFVYPHKAVLKTCGTTTLLLVMPKLLALAKQIGAPLSHVHYSHLRYKYPHLQLYPHASFDEEKACLSRALEGHAADVAASILGPEGGTAACWYALCANAATASTAAGATAGAVATTKAAAVKATPPPAMSPATAPRVAPSASDEAVLEVAMEGLDPSVCATFVGTSPMHAGLSGKALATSMSRASGITDLVAGAILDDWAFEPCGYSMNALRDEHYYTVHITPEPHCSYASFETTDPAYCTPEKLAAVLAIFQPSTFTLTLTTRTAATIGRAAAANTTTTTSLTATPTAAAALALETSDSGFVLGTLDALDTYTCASNERTQLTPAVAVTCATFATRSRIERSATCATVPLSAPSPSPCDEAASAASSASEAADEAAGSSADSSADTESTAGLDEVREACDDVPTQQADKKKRKTC